MASSRDEPLSKEEQEEEYMRHELSDAGFYEENMGLEEMRQLMKAVNESKKTIYGNVASHSTPIKESQTANKSSEYTYNNSFLKEIQGNSTANEPSYEKNSLLKPEDFPALNSSYKPSAKKNVVTDSPNIQLQNKKEPSVENLRKEYMAKYKFDPFPIIEDEPSLQHRNSSTSDKKILSLAEIMENYNEDDEDDESFDELVQKMSEKLEIIQEQVFEAEKPKDREWGSPIKVPMKATSTTDKNTSANKSVNAVHTPYMSLRNTRERATKRKALNNIAAAVRDESGAENSNDEDDNEFVDSKKRKFRQGRKEEPAKKKADNQKSKEGSKDVEMVDVFAYKEEEFEEFDNSDLCSLRKSKRKSPQPLPSIAEDKPKYPIRVTPPIPGKKNYKGPRARNKKSTSLDNSSLKEKLSEEEIQKVLEKIDEQIDDNDCIDITDEVKNEIKPAPMMKNAQKKIQMAQTHLVNAREAEEKQIKNEEDAKKHRELENLQKKNDIAKKLYEQREETKKLEAEKEKKEKAREEHYNSIINVTKNTRVTRAQEKKINQVNNEEIDEDVLLEEDDEPKITHANLVPKSICPICQGLFPPDKIEEHASGCDAFSQNFDEPNVNQPSTSYDSRYTCGICKKFNTWDGIDYEEHVIKCREQSEDDKRTGIFA